MHTDLSAQDNIYSAAHFAKFSKPPDDGSKNGVADGMLRASAAMRLLATLLIER